MGPELRFGLPGRREVWFLLQPGCDEKDEVVAGIGGARPPANGAVCRGSVVVAAAGDRRFVDDVLREVRVDKVAIRR